MAASNEWAPIPRSVRLLRSRAGNEAAQRANATAKSSPDSGPPTVNPHHVFVYLETLPSHTGSGAEMRMYSSVRAYLDLGWETEIVHIARSPRMDPIEFPSGTRVPVRGVKVGPDSGPSVLGRLGFRLGLPIRPAVEFHVGIHRPLRAAVSDLMKESPQALHHFEGEAVASVIPFMDAAKSIWSVHDVPSSVSRSVALTQSDLEGRGISAAEYREIRFVRRLEDRMASHASMMLCISDRDRREFATRGFMTAETWPMSVPRDHLLKKWIPPTTGDLELLHIGRISHLPSYSSLVFLLGEVLPLLSPDELKRLHLRVVGRSDEDNPRARRIRLLATRYPPEVVTFEGYVPDLDPVYASSHVQVVASTEATGLRTRIVESFARGLPVLASERAADGVLGLESGTNILIGHSPSEFADLLRFITANPGRLRQIRSAARSTYEARYGREIVSASLARFLARSGIAAI